MYHGSTKVGATLISATQGSDANSAERAAVDYPSQLERATRGLLELNVAVLEQMDKTIGLAPLRALQSLQRLGPSLVTALGNDLDMLVSTASRLSDRLADAGLITRRVSPVNRRATILEITDAGRTVLDELVTTRTAALQAVIEHMDEQHREALLVGTRAFTEARHTLTCKLETTT
jgi:DNA-binding MarR family transcriptional regulator